jgi:hypothetical protein
MKHFSTVLVRGFSVLTALLPVCPAAAGERPAAAKIESSSAGLTDVERREFVAWALSRPEVRRAAAGHRTRVLRVWSEAVKGEKGISRRSLVLVRDYDAGLAREISAFPGSTGLEIRELRGVPPSAEEIAEGMAIVRRDPMLARFVANRALRLIGGFHNRSTRADDPCAAEICLDFAFLKPDYAGPERYVIVNLTRGIVAHHDFRGGRPGERPPRMTEGAP